jgi:hypothetical protein
MKKIILTVLTFIVLTSCSTDSNFEENTDTTIPKSSARVLDMETLYNEMIISQSYLTLTSKAESFVQKMNYQGDGTDIERDGEILVWISANLSSTSFINYQDAVSQYESVAVSAKAVTIEHESFFNLFSGADLDNPHTFIPWSSDEFSIDSCKKNCQKLYNKRMDMHRAQLQQAIRNDMSHMDEYLRSFNYFTQIAMNARQRCFDACD